MDLNSLELAANIVFRMCREHPEICPHNYQLRYSIQHDNGSVTRRYSCQICGVDFTEVVSPLGSVGDNKCPE